MVTELIIILTLFFIVAGVFVGKLQTTFKDSAPKLGARIEKQIETGSGFSEASQDGRNPILWKKP